MKEWVEVKELMGLPGMPGVKSSVIRKAQRESWISRPRKGRGGGREYAIKSLPPETREALCQETIENLPVKANQNKSLAVYDPEPVQPLEDLKQWQREIFDARVIIFREFERLQSLHGTKSAISKLLALVETNSLPDELQYAAELANARRGSGRTISRAMILRWNKTVKDNGLLALAPKAGAQSNTVPEWANYFIKSYNRPQKPSITDAMNLMAEIMPENMEMPSYDQVKRFNKSRSTIDRERGRHSPNAMRQFKGYVERITDDLEPGEVLLCDGHSIKAKVAHFDHGRPFHPEACAVICAKTRMTLGWSVGVAESGQTVADALRHAITINNEKPYGCIPAIFYTDGGSGNLSKLNTHRITGFYARLGITHKVGIPGNAQGRGMIEILNKSLWIRAAKKLPTFTGREMDSGVQRKVYQILDKAVKKGVTADILPTWQQFVACCAAEVDIYNRTPHSSLPKVTDPNTGKRRHITPLEYWTWHVAVKGWEPTVLPEDMVNDLFYPQMIKPTRRGAVTLFTNRYSNRKVLEAYHGQEVIVEYDIHNAETVRIRDMHQRLLCTASFQSSKARFFPKEVSKIAIENRMKGQKKLVANKLEDINAQLGHTIEMDMSPTPLTADEERRAAELLESYEEPVEEPIEFDESLLEPLRPHMPEKEFDESLLDDRFAIPSATESYDYSDMADEEDEKEQVLPDAVIDARRKFSPAPENDDWLNLDGFERFEFLERKGNLTESQETWIAYFRTTPEYRVLQELYRDIEAQQNK